MSICGDKNPIVITSCQRESGHAMPHRSREGSIAFTWDEDGTRSIDFELVGRIADEFRREAEEGGRRYVDPYLERREA